MLKQILIVDDDTDSRRLLTEALSSAYDLLEVHNGSEALQVLSDRKASHISAILLSLSKSNPDGFAFLSSLRSAPGIKDIPVLVLTDTLDEATEQKGLELGAYDFVPKPFNPSILLFRLKNTIERSKYTTFGKYRYLAEYDAISNIYNRARFFDATRRILDTHPGPGYLLARFDLDRFKAYNDLFGMAAGDRLLLEIGNFFRQVLPQSAVFGRLEADHFAFCVPSESFKAGRFLSDFSFRFAAFQPNFVLSPRLGVFYIEDTSLDVSLMCDRALMALRSIKDGSARRVAYYNESMRKHILEEQALIGDVETALKRQQFEVYLQPQYNHRTHQLVGAEALVRWNHPEKGMIAPNSFIPILEKIGFISRLDYYVWDRVCRLLAHWRETGRPSISVSVNISRTDIQMPNFCLSLINLVRRYGVNPRDLRLEITETAYIQSADQLLSVVDKLREEGFLLEMDDFGKGYSSLNTLKNVPVDILKLDMGFLRESESSGGRGGVILNSVMHMAHWLNIPVIAEGVETLRQADYLTSIGCDIVQGFLYSRPLPIREFEELLARGDIGNFIGDYALLSQLDVQELWDPDSEATTIFKNFVGPAGLFELHEGILELLRVNQKLCDVLELDFQEFRSHGGNVLLFCNDRQRFIILSMLQKAVEQGIETTCQLPFSGFRTHKLILLFIRAHVIAASADRKVFFIGLENITPAANEAGC
jgi:EAL domain-containing protein (putative c-di-GMP-specific phosphodiesterase class I)/DNA-binding response OmpR family regulator